LHPCFTKYQGRQTEFEWEKHNVASFKKEEEKEKARSRVTSNALYENRIR